MSERPGGGLAKRPLHFVWIADCSGSMASDGKIQSLNNAIREAIPHLQEEAAKNPFAQILVRAIAFSNGVRWHVGEPTPVEVLAWPDLHAHGRTDMGAALSEVAAQLRVPPMEARALPPALVLISDGQPTDDFAGGLRALMDQPWGAKAVRLAVAIGRDADVSVLQQFIGTRDYRPVTANNPEQLVAFLRWASTVASKVGLSHNQSVPSQPSVAVPGPPAGGGPDVGVTW